MVKYFTSESVSEGHPDKLADQISDAVLDAYLQEDKNSHVACETLTTRSFVLVSGEVSSKAHVDVNKIARNVIEKVGYNDSIKGLDFKNCLISCAINEQSSEINQAVGSGSDQGAGDQGIMFGYAIDETEEAMPLSIDLANKIVQKLSELRKQGNAFLYPDSKSQVTVRYEDDKVKDIDTIVVSSQHSPDYDLKELKNFITEEVIKPIVPKEYLTDQLKILVNPGGSFTKGGPYADCGLTGRKIIVDTYGGHGAHGGGCFSGKDPSKVDRSASYIARHIAKNIVKADLAKRCLVQLSYAIGVAEPTSILVDHFGTSDISQERLTEIVKEAWDLRPKAIIEELNLLNISYFPTASYGHFGRQGDSFTWEKTDKVPKLKKLANK